MASKAVIEQRVTDVYAQLLNGSGRTEIVREAAKKWGVKPRTVDTYIARATARFAEQGALERQTERGLARARLNLIFAKALSKNDLWAALAAQKEINAIAGLHAKDALNIHLPNVAIQLAPDVVDLLAKDGYELSAVVREFEAMIRETAAGAQPAVLKLSPDTAATLQKLGYSLDEVQTRFETQVRQLMIGDAHE